MKPSRKRRSRQGKDKEKPWKVRGTEQRHDFQKNSHNNDLKIIENTPQLRGFYSQRFLELSRNKGNKRGRLSNRRKQMTAIALTKEFAEENKIKWEL